MFEDFAKRINDFEELKFIAKIIEKISSSAEPSAAFVLKAPNRVSELKTPSLRLGVLSASFNPLTNAHLKLIEVSQQKYRLDEIALLLAKANVDKDIFGMSLIDRLVMLKLFVQTQNRLDLSVILSSHGRFVEKSESLKKIYLPQTQIYFIVGFDTLIRVFDPKYYADMDLELQTLFSMSRFIAANRGQDEVKAIKSFLAQEYIRKFADKIDLIQQPRPYSDISSTEIRDKIKSKADVSGLIPQIVSNFISATGVYWDEERYKDRVSKV